MVRRRDVSGEKGGVMVVRRQWWEVVDDEYSTRVKVSPYDGDNDHKKIGGGYIKIVQTINTMYLAIKQKKNN